MEKQTIAFTNSRIIDGRENSTIQPDAAVLFSVTASRENSCGEILAAGAQADIQFPPGTRLIDLKGKYVLPGLINLHCHMMGDGKPSTTVSGRKASLIFWLAKTPIGRLILLAQMRRSLSSAINAGVTCVRSAGEPFFYDSIIKQEVEKGKYLSPRLINAGPGILPSGGHGAGFFCVADGPWEVRRAVRRNIHAGADFIKILNTGGVSDSKVIGEAGRPQMDPQEIEAACIEAHRAGKMVASHSQSLAGVREALLNGVDTIEHGAEIDRDLSRLYRDNPKSLRGYSVMVPTFSAPHGINDHLERGKIKMTAVQIENSKRVLDAMIKGYQRALKDDIRIGVGTDASVPYVTHYHFWRELLYLVEYGGISNQRAVHLATLNNAEILGIEKETGSIETGKHADLLVVEKNPLDDLSALSQPFMVCRAGRLIEKPALKRLKEVDEAIESAGGIS